VRTPIVEREDLATLVHEQDRAVAAMHNKSTLGPQLLKGSGAHEIQGLAVHRRLIQQGPPQRDSAGCCSPVNTATAYIDGIEVTPRNELLQIDDLRGFDVAAFSSSAADVMKVNRATTPETGAKYASQLTRGISSLRRYAQGH
jgi:hypothetical protein